LLFLEQSPILIPLTIEYHQEKRALHLSRIKRVDSHSREEQEDRAREDVCWRSFVPYLLLILPFHVVDQVYLRCHILWCSAVSRKQPINLVTLSSYKPEISYSELEALIKEEVSGLEVPVNYTILM
jgi:hypothetical protein